MHHKFIYEQVNKYIHTYTQCNVSYKKVYYSLNDSDIGGNSYKASQLLVEPGMQNPNLKSKFFTSFPSIQYMYMSKCISVYAYEHMYILI